jgi:hypothetical protein
VKAQVLQQQHTAIRKALEPCLRLRTNAVIRERYIAPKQLAQVLGHRLQAVLVHSFSPWAAQVGHEDGARSVLHEPLDGREAFPDAAIVGDLSILERNIEVGSHKDTLAAHIEVGNEEFLHVESCLAVFCRRLNLPAQHSTQIAGFRQLLRCIAAVFRSRIFLRVDGISGITPLRLSCRADGLFQTQEEGEW